ncbi:MAG: hypothetical protein QXH97_00225 [Candidatus Bathyarchaeia archaeon]
MVRPASVRIRKYTQKFDPTVVSARFTAVRDLAVEQFQVHAADLEGMEELVKTSIETRISNPLELPQYLDFARELYRLTKRHSGKVLVSEANSFKAKWATRGLNPAILDIIMDLFGIGAIVYS